MSTTARLAERVTAINDSDIDAATYAAVRRIFLDGVAVAVAGAREEAPRRTFSVQARLAASGRSTVIGFGTRLSAAAAAAVNGASTHVLDFEPMWSPPNHAVSTTLPAVLALAEETGADGRAVATALLKGVEMQGRLRLGSGMFEPRVFTFHPPGFVGPLGAATAAAHLLDLGAEQLAHALGIAASRAGTLLANAGTMTKCLHCGLAAADGLEAAFLAAEGITANPDIIDAPAGYAAGFMPELDREVLANYAAPWQIIEPGCIIKRFPCQYGTHFAITAALEIAPQIVDIDDIASIDIVTPVMPYVDRPRPESGLAGKFSFQYTTCAALLDGQVEIESFTDERRFCADVVGLLERVSLRQDQSIPATLESMHVDVTVTLADGHALQARCDGPKGSLRGPPLSAVEHMEKIRACLATAMDDSTAAGCIDLCERLETLNAGDLDRLCGLLGASEEPTGKRGPRGGANREGKG